MKSPTVASLAVGLGLWAAPAWVEPPRAEPARSSGSPPAATVPLPPPQPPERPNDLVPPPPQVTPLPPGRPPELTKGSKTGSDSGSEKKPEALQSKEAPEEAPKDAKDSPAALPEAPLPPERPPELSGEAALALKVSAPDDTACLRRLERLGARFEALAPLGNGQCSAPRPLMSRRSPTAWRWSRPRP